ncbi:hypothetical protein L1987_61124 [Smallanthus sonchifolius]|uniref:Uncharacterized protein n=1 Tax=Smallanthus sonchifolius TaxID=185202 RepID=A0ACB9DA47_9ASTR|nr:hypothetical protein L1987_61124 [Smallanthus sonchifolius]
MNEYEEGANDFEEVDNDFEQGVGDEEGANDHEEPNPNVSFKTGQFVSNKLNGNEGSVVVTDNRVLLQTSRRYDECQVGKIDGNVKVGGGLAVPRQPQGSLSHWDRFLHVGSIKVMLLENDDSTRHIVTALLLNYEGTLVDNIQEI